MRKLLSIYIFLTLWVLNFSSFAATRTANAGGGDWNTAATWDCNCIPSTADDVVIPAGVTVTTAANLSNYKSITVNGTLTVNGNLSFDNDVSADLITVYGKVTVTGNVSFNENQNDQIIVKNGGVFNISGNLGFPTFSTAMAFTIENGGSSYVGGTISDGGLGDININIDGYMEVFGNISAYKLLFNVLKTGTLLIKGAVTGLGSNAVINNNGIITVNGDFNITSIKLINLTDGKLFVFGDINISGSGSFANSGLVQSNSFIVNNVTSFSNTGTLIVLNILDENYGGCPCNNGQAYVDPTKVLVNNNPNCSSTSCKGHWLATSNPITVGRKIWLAADFIGYGLQSDGFIIDKWFDLANTYGFKMSESNTSYQPVLKNNSSDNINFNPVISFSGGKHMDLDANNLFPANKGMAMFAVVVPSGNAGNSYICDYGLNPTYGFGLGYNTTNAYSYTPTASGGAINQISSHGRSTKATLLSHTTIFGTSKNQVLNIKDGDSTTSTSTTNLILIDDAQINNAATANGTTEGPFTIGASSANPLTNKFEGNLAELIVYATKVSRNVQYATESYLALKYGITLNHDYLTHDSVTIRTYDPVFNKDVAGLAREDYNLFEQRQSKSINSGAELTVSVGTIVTDDEKNAGIDIFNNNSFLVWSHNNGTVGTLGRVYKFSAKNFNQSVKLRFTIPGLSPTPQLMIADDPSFTTNVRYVTATSYTDPILDYTVTFTDNKSQYCVLKVPAAASTPGVLISETAPYPTIKNTAELQIYSKSRGVLLPTMTSTTLPANPPKGLLVYCTDVKRYMYYNGTAWSYVGGLINKLETDLSTYFGTYLGQLVYTTDTKFVYYWNGTSWVKLQ